MYWNLTGTLDVTSYIFFGIIFKLLFISICNIPSIFNHCIKEPTHMHAPTHTHAPHNNTDIYTDLETPYWVKPHSDKYY